MLNTITIDKFVISNALQSTNCKTDLVKAVFSKEQKTQDNCQT
jgi:hypothetical protein